MRRDELVSSHYFMHHPEISDETSSSLCGCLEVIIQTCAKDMASCLRTKIKRNAVDRFTKRLIGQAVIKVFHFH